MRTNRASWSGFTLIELLVVLTLLSIIAGMTFVRLDDVSDDARLRACAANHASVMKLAQVQATSSGEPRLVEYGPGSLLLRRPSMKSGSWEWDEGMRFDLPAGVQVEGIITLHESRSDKKAIRMNADGRGNDHAVIFHTHNRWMAALFCNTGEPQLKFFERKPEFSTWSNLVEMITTDHAKP